MLGEASRTAQASLWKKHERRSFFWSQAWPNSVRAPRGGPRCPALATVYNASVTAWLGFPGYYSLSVALTRCLLLSPPFIFLCIGVPAAAVTSVGVAGKRGRALVRGLLPIPFICPFFATSCSLIYTLCGPYPSISLLSFRDSVNDGCRSGRCTIWCRSRSIEMLRV
jgi:hypothetical protein